ncbi:MAG: hypothetical protein E7Z96_08215 [Actinomycetaceae bacterium]|jgi:hypothetical protein|nr:hypothetical protein [Actinomycetaceae bacterium]
MGRQHRAAMRLSRVDRERLESGEFAHPEDALRAAAEESVADNARGAAAAEHAGAASAQRRDGIKARDAHEQDLLAEVPPHFGKL